MNANRFQHIDEPWPFAPKPATGEHVMGYVRRLAEANDLDSLSAFWISSGLKGLCPWSSDAFWSQLQRLTGLHDSHIDELRWPRTKSLVSLLGQPIRLRFLSNTRLRHCPICIREDGILRPAWFIYHVTACTRHNCRLEEICTDCGKELPMFSKSSAWECPRCAADIRHHQGVRASEEELALSAIVESYLTCDQTHSLANTSLNSLTLNQIVSLVDRLGTLASISPDIDPPTNSDKTPYGIGIPDQSGGMEAARLIAIKAFPILHGWPKTYHELLANYVDRNPRPTQRNLLRSRFATEFGLQAIRPILDHDGSIIDVAWKEFHRFCVERLDYRWRQRKHLFQARTGDPHIARASQLFACDDHNNRSRANSNTPPGVRVSDLYMPIDQCMRVLDGNPYSNAEPWFQSGLLIRSGSRNFSIERAQVNSLIARLGSLSASGAIPDDCVKISSLPRFLGHYRRMHFLEDVFSGSLPIYGSVSGDGLGSLSIRMDDLEVRRTLRQLKTMQASGRYVKIHEINPLLEKLWGPMASFDRTEARQWVARGSLRCRSKTKIYTGRPYPDYFYHPTDLVRISQSMFRPQYFELESELTGIQGPQDDSL